MGQAMDRLGILFTQVLFSLLTPPLLIPGLARRPLTRRFIAFCFGRTPAGSYQKIIDTFQGQYGRALAAGLARVQDTAERPVTVIADCGTGTGFVTSQAAVLFPEAQLVSLDLLREMLDQARRNCREIGSRVHLVQADTFSLPLADGSIDLLLVQNTIPWFAEFARVCRPGGFIVYVDTSAGWISGLARRLVARHHWFRGVSGERVGFGFYVLARVK